MAERVYRGVPADERRAERRRQLMEAAMDLMGTEGWPATTVRAVCQRARLTPRFFYESFSGIDELACVVFDEIVDTGIARVIEAVDAAPGDPESKMRAAIRAMVLDLTEDPRRARIAFVEALGSEPLTRRRIATMHTYAQLIAAQARATYHPQDDTFVDLTAAVLAGGMAELLMLWLDGGLDIDRDRLIDDCTALFVAVVDSALAIARHRSR